jgi:hypothetical protein
MDTQQRIDKIAGELRNIYRNTNDGPRLISEMMEREFPFPRRILNGPLPGLRKSGDWGKAATDPL